jgi:hypothetical protein
MRDPQSHNRLLSSMSSADLGLLAPDLEPVTLGLRYILERPNRRIDAIYFPEAGFASVVAVQADDTKVEVGLIGREGMSGLTIVLGDDRSRIRPTCKCPAGANASRRSNYARRCRRVRQCKACC